MCFLKFSYSLRWAIWQSCICNCLFLRASMFFKGALFYAFWVGPIIPHFCRPSWRWTLSSPPEFLRTRFSLLVRFLDACQHEAGGFDAHFAWLVIRWLGEWVGRRVASQTALLLALSCRGPSPILCLQGTHATCAPHSALRRDRLSCFSSHSGWTHLFWETTCSRCRRQFSSYVTLGLSHCKLSSHVKLWNLKQLAVVTGAELMDDNNRCRLRPPCWALNGTWPRCKLVWEGKGQGSLKQNSQARSFWNHVNSRSI